MKSSESGLAAPYMGGVGPGCDREVVKADMNIVSHASRRKFDSIRQAPICSLSLCIEDLHLRAKWFRSLEHLA